MIHLTLAQVFIIAAVVFWCTRDWPAIRRARAAEEAARKAAEAAERAQKDLALRMFTRSTAWPPAGAQTRKRAIPPPLPKPSGQISGGQAFAIIVVAWVAIMLGAAVWITLAT